MGRIYVGIDLCWQYHRSSRSPQRDWERDWVVNVGAGTKVLGIDCDYLMKSSCKSPDVTSWDYVHE